MGWIVTLGVQFLTGVAGGDRWSTERKLAQSFSDREAADKIACRINDMRLGNTRAKVKMTRK